MGVMIPTFAAWVWLTLVDGRYRLELNWVLVTLVAYLLSATFSALSGPDPTLSFWSKHERLAGVIAHFHLFTFFLVLSSFLREEKDWKTFFSVAVSIASLVSFWGVAQNHGFRTAVSVFDSLHFISEDVSAISNEGSTLGNTSFMGSYLQMNAFLSIYLIVTSTGNSRVLAVVSFTLILLGVYLNPGGRAMRYSVLAGLILIAFLYLAVKSDRVAVRGFSKFVLCSAGLVSFALFFASLSEGSVVNEKFSAIRGGGTRIQTWKMAWEGIREKPIFGWGFENFELAFYRHFNPEILVGIGTTVQEHWYDRSHNVVFDLLLTGGFVGAGLFFLVVAVSLYTLWNDYFLSDRRRLGVCVVLTAMFAAHFIQNLSVFDMLPSNMLLFATFAYVSSKAVPIVSVVHRFREFRPASAVPILSFICLSFASGVAFYHFVYKPHRVARIVAKFSAGSLPGPLKDEYIVASETSPVGRHQVRIQLAESAMKRLEFLENSEKDVFYLGEVDYVISQLEKSAQVVVCHPCVCILEKVPAVSLDFRRAESGPDANQQVMFRKPRYTRP
jgi:O-antigen ligase